MSSYDLLFISVNDVSTTHIDGFAGSTGGWHLYGHTVTFSPTAIEDVLSVADTDLFFDDDDPSQELSGDMTINGTTYPPGTLVDSEYTMNLQDSLGNSYKVFAVSAGPPPWGDAGNIVGFVFEGAPPPYGEELTFVGNEDSTNSTYLYSNTAAAPTCFVRGTMIATGNGEVAIENLKNGDLVQTADHGLQPIKLVLRRKIKFGRANNKDRPIQICRGSLGPGLPCRDTAVSPQHKILLRETPSSDATSKTEILVAAKALVSLPGIREMKGKKVADYIHLAFKKHEVIFANNLATESFFPGPMAMQGLDKVSILSLLALFPGAFDAANANHPKPARAVAATGKFRRTLKEQKVGQSRRICGVSLEQHRCVQQDAERLRA